MFAVILSLLLSAQAGYDVIIKNGTVVDGSGAARFSADIAIRGDLRGAQSPTNHGV